MKLRKHRVIKYFIAATLMFTVIHELVNYNPFAQQNFYSRINYRVEEKIYLPVNIFQEKDFSFSIEISKQAESWRHNYEFVNPGKNSITVKKCIVYRGKSSVLLEPKLKGAFLIFVVNTSAKNFHRRNMLRQMFEKIRAFMNLTLGSKIVFEVVFSIGASKNISLNDKLMNESAVYEDLLMSSIDDSYKTLTLKTFFSMQVRATTTKLQFLF